MITISTENSCNNHLFGEIALKIEPSLHSLNINK